MLLTAIAAIPLLIWVYLTFARGGFWRTSTSFEASAPHPSNKRAIAIIPARNEARVIARSLQSLLQQGIEVILVDDGSTDSTAEIAHAVPGNVTILRGQPLPPGWTGKLWALSQGVAYAEELAPDYFLLTDADIDHASDSISKLMSIADSGDYDLTSYMVKLSCTTTAEKALIPAFVFFFLMLYPPAWIACPRFKTAAAAGGCILIRASALQSIGGLATIRSEMIDDCALARAVKRNGGRIWMGLTRETESIRHYDTFAEFERVIARTAFNQLNHSLLWLIAAISGLIFTCLLPPLLVVCGTLLPSILAAAAWLLMSICYLPMLRFYGRSPAWVFTLPLVAMFYAGATIHSAFAYWRGRGGEWKGRIQDVPPSAPRT